LPLPMLSSAKFCAMRPLSEQSVLSPGAVIVPLIAQSILLARDPVVDLLQHPASLRPNLRTVLSAAFFPAGLGPQDGFLCPSECA
jgi:hypothetical protein